MDLFTGLRLLQLGCYILVASQLLFYLFLLSDAMRVISIPGFVELRKTIDIRFAGRLKVLYYLTLAVCFLTVAAYAGNLSSPVFISSAIAFLFLLADVIIASKGNMPINKVISSSAYREADLELLRMRWLNYIRYRGLCIAAGTIVLLLGLLYS